MGAMVECGEAGGREEQEKRLLVDCDGFQEYNLGICVFAAVGDRMFGKC